MEKAQVKLKHKAEDFIVEEIQGDWRCKISKDFIQPPIKINQSQKDFLWCELEKREIDHFTAIKTLADFLDKSMQSIGYAGTKDKVAHTSQRISIEKPDIKKLSSFNNPNIILKNFKWNRRKIKIGYLDTNHFKITLRDIDKKDAMKISSQIRKTSTFPNFFGRQRFGINQSNIKIGEAIIKRNFDNALELIKKESSKLQNIQSIKQVPRKILLMYINAVQSKIFNDIITQALEENLNLELKGQQNGILAGYKTKVSGGRLGEIEQEVLKRHGLALENFNITEIPFLRMKGSFRKAVVRVEDLDVEIEDDEEFLGTKKIILEFTLPSGVYATTFLENFFEF